MATDQALNIFANRRASVKKSENSKVTQLEDVNL